MAVAIVEAQHLGVFEIAAEEHSGCQAVDSIAHQVQCKQGSVMTEILIIDDDLGEFKPGLQQALRGYPLRFAESGEEGLRQLGECPRIGVVLLDIKMPPHFAKDEGLEGLEVLKRIRQEYPALPVIMLTVLTDIDLVVEAIQEGAFHYITKPIDRDKLRGAVARATENVQLKERVDGLNRARDALLRVHTGPAKRRSHFHGMIGSHPLMRELYARIERAAPFEDMNVVFLGESGAGKDLAARAIHACSPRAQRPFVAVNCAAIAESVLEAELFGHEKGAFTGADEARQGLFRRADGGTLFLDEIGEMSPALQTKLLRAIENREITPLGGAPTPVDVRIVCATNRDLSAAKDDGRFREDLFYRIWDIPVTLPPLRGRKADIPKLVLHFLNDCATRNHVDCDITRGAVGALTEYDWPGNVRELAAVVRRMVVFATDGCITEKQVRQTLGLAAGTSPEPEVLLKDIAAEPAEPEEAPAQAAADISPACAAGELPEIADITEFRRIHGEIVLTEVITRAIQEGGNARAAMTLLGMPEDKYDAFRKWLQRLGIKVREVPKGSD